MSQSELITETPLENGEELVVGHKPHHSDAGVSQE